MKNIKHSKLDVFYYRVYHEILKVSHAPNKQADIGKGIYIACCCIGYPLIVGIMCLTMFSGMGGESSSSNTDNKTRKGGNEDGFE